jgi:hypothetical protein
MADKTVDAYIAGLGDWRGEVVEKVRRIVLKAAPGAKESIKWAQPVYELGGPFAYMKAFKSAVNFGFWRGVELKDPKGLLQGTGAKMRHVKIADLKDIDAKAFTDYVKQAVRLNAEKGDPTRG